MHSNRCLYNSNLCSFLSADSDSIFGVLCKNYHGDAPTITRDAWIGEIDILKEKLSNFSDLQGRIIFEYDIPRLGKRIDTVLLLQGIIFCIEFNYFIYFGCDS